MFEGKISLGDASFVVTDKAIRLTKNSNKWVNTAHFHADFEIHMVLSGNAVIEIDGEDFKLKEGEICLLAPKSSHYPKESSEDLVKPNFSFNITRNYSYHNAEKSFSEYAYYDNIFRSVKSYMILNELELIKITSEILELEICEKNEHVLQTQLASFFIKLANAIKKNNLLSDNQIAGDSYESDNSFKQRRIVEDFFQRRYNEQISIEDLAEKLCLSVPQTHRIVKKIFGVGFKKILTKQRIDHACMLIKNKQTNLEEVAYQSGYTSYNGFLSAFKKYTGKNPKEYQKTLA